MTVSGGGASAKRKPSYRGANPCQAGRSFLSWIDYRLPFPHHERSRAVLPSVAVVGATGAVGEIMRQVLVEHKFALRGIKFLASARSAGKAIDFAGKQYPVEPLRP